jgi:ankyrin repeat protein
MNTELFYALHTHNYDRIPVLIKSGININTKNSNGITPLIYAISNNLIDIAKLLIENGADINAKNKNGITPLMVVHNIEIAKLLIENGADVNAKDNNDVTSLMYTDDIEIAKLLIENGADVNAKDKDGKTPLMYAVNNVNNDNNDNNIDTSITQLLLEHGADINAVDKDDKSAIMMTGNNDVIELLIQYGATDINIPQIIISNKNITTNTNLLDQTALSPIVHITPISGELWKGFSQSDIMILDTIFKRPTIAQDYSFCPFCLEYVIHISDCIYMNHNCVHNSYNNYHKELYNKFRYENTVQWCTVCGRPSKEHKHYALSFPNSSKMPELLPHKTTRRTQNTLEYNCIYSNGGGLPEKLARFHRLRQAALELNKFIGKISKEQAKNYLVEEMMKGAMVKTKELQKIGAEMKWNVNISEFPKTLENNNYETENSLNAQYEMYANKLKELESQITLPTISNEGWNNVAFNNINTTAGEKLVQFHHRQKNGVIYDHIDSKVGTKFLTGYIEEKVKNFANSDSEFGKCYGGSLCNSYIYPSEIKGLVPDKLYKRYEELFIKRVVPKLITSGGDVNSIFYKADDATCSIPSIKSQKGGQTYKNGKKSKNGRKILRKLIILSKSHKNKKHPKRVRLIKTNKKKNIGCIRKHKTVRR